MADEIPDQNVARVTFAGDRWRAAIGPDELGLAAEADDPGHALFLLSARVMTEGWLFDPSWRPRGVPSARMSILSRARRWLTRLFRNRRRATATP